MMAQTPQARVNKPGGRRRSKNRRFPRSPGLPRKRARTITGVGSRSLVARMIHIPRPVGTLLFLLAWLTPLRPAFRIRAKQSELSFFVDRRDLIGRHIAKYGTHEPLLTQWLSDYLTTPSRGIFVDVGANLGWQVVHAAQHKAVETVVAFEPDAFNAWLLD